MATEQELLDSAAAHARKTSWTWEKWLNEIATNPGYRRETTEWWKAGADLQTLKSTPPGPPPTPAGRVFQNIIVVSDTPEQALESPSHYGLLFSADPAYQNWQDLIPEARAQLRWVGVWCDCRTTLPDTAKGQVAEYALDGWAGQAESPAEFDTAIGAGAPFIIANCTALTPVQRDIANQLIAAGSLSVTQEAYSNCGWPWPDATSAAGVNVSSLCVGLYDGSSEVPGGRYVTVEEYEEHTPPAAWQAICAYVSGSHPGELARLP
jgi:hypothetical protein